MLKELTTRPTLMELRFRTLEWHRWSHYPKRGDKKQIHTHLLLEVNDKCVNLLNSIVNQAIEPQEEVRRFGT